MEQDKLTDFERAEYYKARLKAKTGYAYIIAVLMFAIGFAVARALYLTVLK